MLRERLGVALLVPGPAAFEIDGLRRGLGDGALGRIPAHLTLVPPVNVAADRVPEALSVLRAAAAEVGPLRLVLGPVATFHPVTPVVYLAVEGDLDRLAALRDAVFRPPLARTLTHPFVPHVTLADDLAPGRIPAALTALTDARLEVAIDRVHLLREERGRVWYPIADAPLGPRRVVGRGGLPLEVTVSSQPDPEAARLLAQAPPGAWSAWGGWGALPGTEPTASPTGAPSAPPRASPGAEPTGPPAGGPAGRATSVPPGHPAFLRPFAVAARRDGELVGVAQGWTVGPLSLLAALVVVEGARRQGVGGHLLAAVEHEARDRKSRAVETVAPDDPAVTALLAGAGWQPAGEAYPGWRRWGRVLVDRDASDRRRS